MLRLVSLIVVLVLSPTAASLAKQWDVMSVEERMAWAMNQIPKPCRSQLSKLTAEEKAFARQQIAFADQASVESTIRMRCALASASRQ
jgi:hypothetical protein